jgi:hypothetical protein
LSEFYRILSLVRCCERADALQQNGFVKVGFGHGLAVRVAADFVGLQEQKWLEVASFTIIVNF